MIQGPNTERAHHTSNTGSLKSLHQVSEECQTNFSNINMAVSLSPDSGNNFQTEPDVIKHTSCSMQKRKLFNIRHIVDFEMRQTPELLSKKTKRSTSQNSLQKPALLRPLNALGNKLARTELTSFTVSKYCGSPLESGMQTQCSKPGQSQPSQLRRSKDSRLEIYCLLQKIKNHSLSNNALDLAIFNTVIRLIGQLQQFNHLISEDMQYFYKTIKQMIICDNQEIADYIKELKNSDFQYDFPPYFYCTNFIKQRSQLIMSQFAAKEAHIQDQIAAIQDKHARLQFQLAEQQKLAKADMAQLTEEFEAKVSALQHTLREKQKQYQIANESAENLQLSNQFLKSEQETFYGRMADLKKQIGSLQLKVSQLESEVERKNVDIKRLISDQLPAGTSKKNQLQKICQYTPRPEVSLAKYKQYVDEYSEEQMKKMTTEDKIKLLEQIIAKIEAVSRPGSQSQSELPQLGHSKQKISLKQFLEKASNRRELNPSSDFGSSSEEDSAPNTEQ